MLKVDTETGRVVRHDFGNRIAGEAVFVPRGASAEDDGYLAIFTFDPEDRTSDFVLLDAAQCRCRTGRRGAAAAARAARAARNVDREGVTLILMLRSRHRR